MEIFFESELNSTRSPDVALAERLNGISPKALSVMGGNEITCGLFFCLTIKVCATTLAVAKFKLPCCEAVISVAPTPVIVTSLPLIVATDRLLLEYETASREELTAFNENLLSPKILEVTGGKSITC